MVEKRTVESFKLDLEDNLNSLIKKRDNLVLEVRKVQSDIENNLEKLFAIDTNKVRIVCSNCRGTGISPSLSQDGKKQFCEVCGGPDKPYLWAEKYSPKKGEDV